MSILKKLFSRKVQEHPPEDVTKIAACAGSLIEKTAWDIFTIYRMELLSEPITYIVPAVWGVNKDGELTSVQRAIHNRVSAVIEEINNTLQIKNLNSSQDFAIKYLVRGLIISKITYMIESFRNKLNERAFNEKGLKESLIHINPHGTA